jgi:hypothetical protein
MYSRIAILASSIAVAVLALTAQPLIPGAYAACSPQDKINNTTAQDAIKATEQAGYTQVHILAKGCDSAWHASAMLNGKPVFVVWNREGQVVTEGD